MQTSDFEALKDAEMRAYFAQCIWFASGVALGSGAAIEPGWLGLVLLIAALGLGLYAQSLSSEAREAIGNFIKFGRRS